MTWHLPTTSVLAFSEVIGFLSPCTRQQGYTAFWPPLVLLQELHRQDSFSPSIIISLAYQQWLFIGTHQLCHGQGRMFSESVLRTGSCFYYCDSEKGELLLHQALLPRQLSLLLRDTTVEQGFSPRRVEFFYSPVVKKYCLQINLTVSSGHCLSSSSLRTQHRWGGGGNKDTPGVIVCPTLPVKQSNLALIPFLSLEPRGGFSSPSLRVGMFLSSCFVKFSAQQCFQTIGYCQSQDVLPVLQFSLEYSRVLPFPEFLLTFCRRNLGAYLGFFPQFLRLF